MVRRGGEEDAQVVGEADHDAANEAGQQQVAMIMMKKAKRLSIKTQLKLNVLVFGILIRPTYEYEYLHPAFHDDAGWLVELPLPRALGAELAAVPVEHADAVVAAVSHHDQALGRAADAPGPAQVTVPAPLLAELQYGAAEKIFV